MRYLDHLHWVIIVEKHLKRRSVEALKGNRNAAGRRHPAKRKRYLDAHAAKMRERYRSNKHDT